MAHKTVNDITAEIKRLENERVELIKKISCMMGEVLLESMPDAPQTKKGLKEYLAAVNEILRRHNDEFAAIRRGAAMPKQGNVVKTYDTAMQGGNTNEYTANNEG